jgi:hypothetical protein
LHFEESVVRVKYLIGAIVLAGAFATTFAAFGQESVQPQGVGLPNLQLFGLSRDVKSDADALLRRASDRPIPVENAGASFDLGRFHASLGGVSGKHVQLGSYRLDTSEFLNSSISGSVDGRGAKVMFTLPLQ